MRATLHAIISCLVVAMGLSAAAPLRAQSSATVNPDLNPYGSYHGADFESVTLLNGGLYLHTTAWTATATTPRGI